MIAEVIVDIAHSEVDKIFEYRAGENVRAGSRVKVPFSRGVADGYVMRLKETSDFSADRLKDILSVVDEIPVLTEECLQLAYSIAERYKCPKALVLRLFLPAEMRKGGVRELYKSVAVYRKDCELSARANKQLSALEFIRENGRFDYTALCEKFGRAAVNALAEKGAIALEKQRVARSPYKNVEGEP